MRRPVLFGVGAVLLGAIWMGPLPGLATHRFSAHMTMHMGVVAVATPLISLALARPWGPASRMLPASVAVPASILELIVVWAWHAPALHQFARTSSFGLVIEQGMFFATSLLVWTASFGGDRVRAGARTGAGVLALLLTSMHMTLLGTLIALASRPLYAHLDGMSALEDQQLGGAIMLIVGGVSYLVGGLTLARRLLGAGPSVPAGERI